MSGFIHQTFHLTGRIEIQILQLFKDNYCYFILNKEGPSSPSLVLVDPADPETVSKFISHNRWAESLKAILTTHHHSDHSGGNEQLAKQFPGIQIYGGDTRIPAMTHQVKDREIIEIGGLSIEVLFTPCHTTGHVTYHLKDHDQNALFTGDTLFSGGCGRFFEGTAEQMHKSLSLLASFPDATFVFCGHEYTLSNLLFASEVESDNTYLKEKLNTVKLQREKNQFTVPSTIGEERRINPFLRLEQASILHSLSLDETTHVHERMKQLRLRKDHWKSPL